MGCDIREKYYFVGSVEGVKAWRDFLYPCSVSAHSQLEEMELYDEEWNNIVFGLSEKLEKLIEEKYPIDSDKAKKTHIGFFMDVGDLKISGDWACFECGLDNRNSISAYIFKELLDKYFHGVFMYFQYSGDSYMFNTYCSNDREMRFFDYAPEGTLHLVGGWNAIGVLYDGNYSRDEIASSYRLFLGNTDINPKYIPVFCGEEALRDGQYEIEDTQAENAGIAEPGVDVCRAFSGREMSKEHGIKPEWQHVAQRSIDYEKYPALKNTPHVIGTRKDGTPYLYQAVAYSKTVQVPSCITDFAEDAFDFDVLYESSYDFAKEYGGKDYVLVLTDEQKAKFSKDMLKEAMFFFDAIKTESDEMLYYKAKECEQHEQHATAEDSAGSGFPDDIPF